MIMANGLYDELTFLQGMLSWWVCWVSVRSPAAAPAREGPLQGRVFYHHWRSPNRWSQKTTARDSDIPTFSFLHTPALHTYCFWPLTTSVLSEKIPSCRLSGAIIWQEASLQAIVPARSSSWHTHPPWDQVILITKWASSLHHILTPCSVLQLHTYCFSHKLL